MNKIDSALWWKKNERLNADLELTLGMVVRDVDGNHGVVVKIELPEGVESVENHGCVYVWQRDRSGYGDDNCEHYTLAVWRQMLRVVDPSPLAEPLARHKPR